MPSRVPEDMLSAPPQFDERARFLASMAEGLHAMAQPLTILRSSVAASVLPDIPAAKRQRYLELSAEQVQRTCVLFEFLQDLVIANQIEAERAPIDLAAMISAVAGDRTAALHNLGISLDMVLPGTVPMSLGDVSRTQQAIQAALSVVTKCSSSGDVIEMTIDVSDQLVELTIQNAHADGVSLGSPERLSLSLAQANMLSQNGQCEHLVHPLRLRLALPLLASES